MPRSFITGLFGLTLAAGTIFGQFGGIQLPGRTRNPNGGPQGRQVPNGTQNSKAIGPTETLTGTLQQISATDLVLDAGDDRIILVKIQNGTKYLSTADKVKAADFEPGDHVTVEATRDDTDHYFSKTITMNKKGTAADKAAASQASSNASRSNGSGSSSDSDSDPDRPRLRRGGADSPDATASNSPPANQPARRSTETDSGQTAVTTSRDSSGASRSVSNNDGVGGSTPMTRRPAVQPGDTSGPSVAVADDSAPPVLRRSSAAQAASDRQISRPSVTAADDSGPPVLRRSSPPPASDSDRQVASAESPRARPSLSAEDAGGVTKLPEAPPPGTGPEDNQGQRRATAGTYSRNDSRNDGGGDPVIEQARDAAFSFSETLPNYVVKQITNRYATGGGRGGRTSWQALDIVTTDLVYEEGKERYTNIMVNGKPTKYIEQTGSWSEGEFASMLQAILAPATNASFQNQKSVTIANRTAWRYDYTVEQSRSSWTLHADGQTVTPSYTGSIWIDKATSRVLRIEIAARNLPRNYPMDSAESSIDYGFVMIGTQSVLLPAAADSLSCTRGSPDCTKNHTEFHNYRKYGADANITFDDAVAK